MSAAPSTLVEITCTPCGAQTFELRFNSLFCSTGTVVAADVSRYWFADTVHLTPYGYQLLARVVTDAMTRAGWLAPAGRRPCDALFSSRCTLAPLP